MHNLSFWLGLAVGTVSGLFLGGLLAAMTLDEAERPRGGRVAAHDVPDLRTVDGAGAPHAVPAPAAAPPEVPPHSDLVL